VRNAEILPCGQDDGFIDEHCRPPTAIVALYYESLISCLLSLVSCLAYYVEAI